MSICRSGRPRAFTLIELLVVVAIIALLISILLPSLSQAKRQAKRVQCSAQLHDIGISLISYYNDFNRLPNQNTSGTETRRDERRAVAVWTYAVHKEIASHMGGLQVATKNIETGELTRAHPVFYCPFVPADDVTFSDVLSGPGTGFGLPDMEDVYLHIGYAYYGRLDECGNDPAKEQPPDGVINEDEMYYLKRQHYADRTPTADDVLMADTIQRWAGGGEWRVNHGVGWGYPLGSIVSDVPPEIRGANELFGDGHAEWLGPQHFHELIGKKGSTLLRGYSLLAGSDRWWW